MVSALEEKSRSVLCGSKFYCMVHCPSLSLTLQIDKKLMQAGGMVARVRNEVEIQSRLKHPAILELYNYFEDSNYVYLVLEICRNGELNRYLHTSKTRMTEEEGMDVQSSM